MQEYRELCDTKKPKKLLPIALCVLLALAGIGLYVWKPLIGLCVAGAAVLLFVLTFVLLGYKTRSYRRKQEKAEQILQAYDVEDVSELPELLEEYLAQQQSYEELLADEEEQRRYLAQQLQKAQESADAISREVKAFAPDCDGLTQCRRVISAALQAHAALSTEQRSLESLQAQCRSMHSFLGNAPMQQDQEALEFDEDKLRYEQRSVSHRLLATASKIAEQQGRISATGDITALRAKREQVELALSQAHEEAQVVELAMAALQTADRNLRSRFSPRITAEAGKILSELTQGKYEAVLLQPDMQMSVRDEGLLRPAAAMSCGTADQMYLALRLAMSRLLLPEDAPLILDDALVNFDDRRCEAALKLLQKEAEKRQIVFFTCRALPQSC